MVLHLDASEFVRQAACVPANVFRIGALDLHDRLGRVRVQALAGPRGLLLARGLVIECVWVRASSGLRSCERGPPWWCT
jgi:hypothetical protein